MPALLGIIILVVAVALAEKVPGHVWIGVGIVAACITAFIATWFALTYLLKASIGIVTRGKD
jgi:Kef-type K+ transport system membrane component KefB